MAYPSYSPPYATAPGLVDWHDLPAVDTPIDRLSLRALEQKLADWAEQVAEDRIVINALDHGVKLDGSADDQPALQAALTTFGPGFTVYVPPGEALLLSKNASPNAGLLMPEGGHLLLAPGATITAGLTMSSLLQNADTSNGNADVFVEGGTIRSQGAVFLADHAATNQLTNVSFLDRTAAGGVKAGMSITGPGIAGGTTVLSISGTTITLSAATTGSGTQQGFVCSWVTNAIIRIVGGNDTFSHACRDGTVMNVEATLALTNGVKFVNARRGSLLGCKVHANGSDGVDFWGWNRESIAIGNRIWCNGDDDISIASQLSGVDATALSERTVCSGNILGNENGENSGGGGITIRGSRFYSVVGNIINGTCFSGLVVNAPGDPTATVYHIPTEDGVIAGNVINGAGQYVSRSNVPSATDKGYGIHLLTSLQSDFDTQRQLVVNNVVRNSRNDAICLAPLGDPPTNAVRNIRHTVVQGNLISWGTSTPGGSESYTPPGFVLAGVGGITADMSGKGNLYDTAILDNMIVHSPGPAIEFDCKGLAVAIARLTIDRNFALDAGTVASPAAAGIRVAGVTDPAIRNNWSASTNNAAKTQTYGIELDTLDTNGSLLLTGNILSNAGQAGAITGRVHVVGTVPKFSVIEANPGYNPWDGEVDLGTGAWTSVFTWTGGGVWRRTATVNFNVDFEATVVPQVMLTVDGATSPMMSAVLTAADNNSFTLALFATAAAAPSTSAKAKVNWRARAIF